MVSRRILGRAQKPLDRLFDNMALRAVAQDMNMVSQRPGEGVGERGGGRGGGKVVLHFSTRGNQPEKDF